MTEQIKPTNNEDVLVNTYIYDKKKKERKRNTFI